MKTYSSYNNQIQGFRDVLETVKTIEKIAASSVHFLKNEVANLSTYKTHIEQTLARLLLFYQKNNHPLLKEYQQRAFGKEHLGSGKRALVVIMGDKGLVGGLWHQITNLFLEKKGKYHTIIMLGKKGGNYFEEEHVNITKTFQHFSAIPQAEEIQEVRSYVFDAFRQQTFSQVDILYAEFVTLAQQRPTTIPFLPFTFSEQDIMPQKESALGFPIFEPSKRAIFDQLLQKYIGVYLHKIILEAKLSELSSRTVAMEHADAKTKEYITQIDHNFKKTRRRMITARQLESFSSHIQ